jgi:hypothetical protein
LRESGDIADSGRYLEILSYHAAMLDSIMASFVFVKGVRMGGLDDGSGDDDGDGNEAHIKSLEFYRIVLHPISDLRARTSSP